MSKIEIGFSSPKHELPGAAAIRVWMNRPYSHVYVKLRLPGLPPAVFHATGKMLHFLHVERFDANNTTVKSYSVEVTQAQQMTIFCRCLELAGTRYGFVDLFKIAFADTIFALTGKTVPLKDSPGRICSELVAEILNLVQISTTKPPHLTKPSDIDSALEAIYGPA